MTPESFKSAVLIFSRPSRGLKIPFLKASLIFLRSVASPKERWLILWLKSIFYNPAYLNIYPITLAKAWLAIWKLPGTLLISM